MLTGIEGSRRGVGGESCYTYLFGFESAGYLCAILGAEAVGQLAGLRVAALCSVGRRIRSRGRCCRRERKRERERDKMG